MSLRHCEAEQESVEVVHLRFRPPLRARELTRAVDLLPLQMLFRFSQLAQRSRRGYKPFKKVSPRRLLCP